MVLNTSTDCRTRHAWRSVVVAVGVTLLAACQSTQSTKSAESPSKTESLRVRVDGAEATSPDERTITLNYPTSTDKNDIIPDWVINPGLGGVLGAVGVASKSALGTREQLEEARLSGRLELASTLEVRLQSVGRGQLESQVNATTGGPIEDSRKSRMIIDRFISDMVLAGTRQRALWFDPANDECYVWMVLDGAVLQKVAHSSIQDVSVFVATVPIAMEYKPKRREQVVPKVIVEAPQGPTPVAEPPGPVEKLESRLKPIETIPLKPKKEPQK